MKKSQNKGEQRINTTDGNFYLESQPISQVEIQQKYIHLQTILMLTQLNSAYYEMQLSLHKTLTKLENKYYEKKMYAFIGLRNFKSHIYQYQANKNNKNYCQISHHYNDTLQTNDINSIIKTRGRYTPIFLYNNEESKGKLVLKTKKILRNVQRTLNNKICNAICYSFYQMLKSSNETSTIKMLSDKSSKIQTIDSQKSKIFKRSTEKRVNRKSFSVQKPIDKSQYLVQIKYQAQQNNTTQQSKNNPIIEQDKNEGNVSELNRLLQKNIDPLSKERKNLLMGRQRKTLKTNSSKKINLSEINNSKQQKINELQYLQRKYTKLISQFNWFSERFLRVIQQQV